jgi:hypothetical protein
MIDVSEIEKYLPYYLTDKERQSLLQEIKDFPDNIDQRFFTTYLKDEKSIFQGDGYSDFLFVNLPDPKVGKLPAIVISNTCDIDQENKRLSPKRIVYAPIFQLKKYRQKLIKDHVETGVETLESIDSHIQAIKKQYVTDIFYLPPNEAIPHDSIVILDRLNNLPANSLTPDEIVENRLFTLSDFGFYMFLVKLSIHFSRVKEEVQRSA